MRPIHAILIPLLAALLASCATLDQDECLSADWYSLGREEGSEGASRDQYQRHREACAKHGINPDKAAYQEGYEHGLDDFCTAANGYQNGRRGYSYQGVCPVELEGGFLLGYQQGKTLYVAQQRVAQYDHAIQERARGINDAEYRIYRYQEILGRRDRSDAEKQQALMQIRYLQRGVYTMRREVNELRYQREGAAMQLMQLNQQGVQGW